MVLIGVMVIDALKNICTLESYIILLTNVTPINLIKNIYIFIYINTYIYMIVCLGSIYPAIHYEK